MVKTAIRRKIPFEYLLVDSWFTNTGLVDFIYRCHKKFHLLGMAKMGNTKYQSKWGELTAKSLIAKLMAYIKRFHDYETIGALFKEIHLGVKELTVVECIWETIIEVVAVIAEMFSLDDEQIISQILCDNRRLQAMRALAQTA